MDLSFPIFEIAIQELEGKPPSGFVGLSNLSCPSAMMLKIAVSPRRKTKSLSLLM
jgi:hypothetical protein